MHTGKGSLFKRSCLAMAAWLMLAHPLQAGPACPGGGSPSLLPGMPCIPGPHERWVPKCPTTWELYVDLPSVQVIKDGDTHQGDAPGEWKFSGGVLKPKRVMRSASKQVNDGERWRLDWDFGRLTLRPDQPLVLQAGVVEADGPKGKTTARAVRRLAPAEWQRLARSGGQVTVRFSGNGSYREARPVAGIAHFRLKGRAVPARNCGDLPAKPQHIGVTLSQIRVILDGDTHQGDAPGEWRVEARAMTSAGKRAGATLSRQVNDGETWRTNRVLGPALTLAPNDKLILEIRVTESDRGKKTVATSRRTLSPSQWRELARRGGVVNIPFSGNGRYPEAQPVKGVASFRIEVR